MARKGSYADVTNIRRKFRKMPKELSREIRAVVTEVSKNIERDAKAAAPVDSGTIRKYISSKVSRDGFTALIGYRTKTARRKAWYAHFVEFGSKSFKPGDKRQGAKKTTSIIRQIVGSKSAQPFLFPAMEKNRSDFIRRSRKAIKKSLRNLNKYKGSQNG